MFALGDEDSEIPFGKKKILFPIGSGEHAMTEKANSVLTSGSVTNGKLLRIIDIPGLDQNKEADIEHIKGIVKKVKDSTSFVKLFIIVING